MTFRKLLLALSCVALAGCGVAQAATNPSPQTRTTPEPPVHHHHARHHHRATKVVCKRDGQISVHGLRHQTLLVRDDYWLGQRPMCLKNFSRHPNFKVVQQAGYSGGRVVAFPYIFTGCAWNACTAGSGLPRRVSRLRNPQVSWYSSEHASGQWNAAMDIWFGRRPIKNGQANGAEIMVWLNTHALPSCAGWPTARIGGRLWCIEHWRASHGGPVAWNYVQFRLLKRTWHVKLLQLAPLFRYAERSGWLKQHWWLENVEAGYEIWSGGLHLTTNWYRVRLR